MITLVIGVVGAGFLLACVARPTLGLLALALLAPFLDTPVFGFMELDQVIGIPLGAGAVYRLVKNAELLPKGGLTLFSVLLFWALYALVAGWFGGFDTFVATAGGLLLALSVGIMFQNELDVAKWFLALGLSVAAINGAMLLIVAFIPPLRGLALKFTSEGVRMIGPYDNPNTFGGVQILVISVLIYFVVNHRSILLRGLASFGIALSFIALLAAQSRAAIGGAFLAMAFIGLGHVLYSRRPIRNLIVAGLAFACVVWMFLNLPDQVFGLDLARLNGSKQGMYDFSVADLEAGRGYLFQGGLTSLSAHPEGLGYVFSLKEEIGLLSGVYQVPHNFALVTLLYYGVIGGTIVILAMVAPVIVCIILVVMKRLSIHGVGFYSANGLMGFLFYNMFHNNTTSVIFWMFWACTIVAMIRSAPVRSSQFALEPKQSRRARQRAFAT